MRHLLSLACLTLFVLTTVRGQSTNGTISGLVTDSSGAVIVGADVLLENDATNVQYSAKTNRDGIYLLAAIPPGTYRLQVAKIGFKALIKPNIVLSVQSALAINFTLPVGAASEVVTVEAGIPLLNTENGAVSTVVSRKYIENMPLNGRSFQDLILLTPGVATNTPQAAGTTLNGNSGEFSVNGQRTESNYYTVDGASANVGIYPGLLGPGTTGSVAAATALGTSQSLVSLGALQEFRVQSSTYSAEYGRNPGGQFSFVTRSGTNELRGTVFDYFRNNVFDANNWFNNYFGKPIPPLRQNDFGGTLGGPVTIPRLYRGKDRTFFFFSYEGLRLTQPQAASISYVPSSSLRQDTPAPLQQVLAAFPIGNGSNLGSGLSEFVGTWSNPSSIDAYSIRLDHSLNAATKVFFRFGDTDSSVSARGTGNSTAPSAVQKTLLTSRTYTFGATNAFSSRRSNEFRLNYSTTSASLTSSLDDFGGAQPADLLQIHQLVGPPGSFQLSLGLAFGPYFTELTEQKNVGLQRQWNLTDSFTELIGRHELKLGIDYRRLTPTEKPGSPSVLYFFFGQNEVEANSPDIAESFNFADVHPLYTNFSAFAQDEWKVAERLSLSIGVRWEVNPPTGVTRGALPLTVEGASDLSTMTLAPAGTRPWATTWYNFAPRLGGAYVVENSPRFETVLRGGGGLFFDTAQQSGSFGFEGPNYQASNTLGSLFGNPTTFPLSPTEALPAIPQIPVPPYGSIEAYPAHLQLPYTIEWNATVEQEIGKSQAVSVAYVGSHASRLLEQRQILVTPSNPNFTYVTFSQNGPTADYNALQIQFQRVMSQGLTALASYTYAHSIDYGSTSVTFPYLRGNSDFDVRHNFSAAVSYDLPNIDGSKLARALIDHWGVDTRFMARTGFPVSLDGSNAINPATGQFFYSGLDLVSGQPVYLYSTQYPGGRSINPAAFTVPPSGGVGDAPRNFARGFGAWQLDLAVRRDFPLYEGLRLQFRAEAFNVLNHPNFGYINPNLGQSNFGQALSTLNASLGVLSPLYQMGGPRSMQFALKLTF